MILVGVGRWTKYVSVLKEKNSFITKFIYLCVKLENVEIATKKITDGKFTREKHLNAFENS